MGKEFKSKCPLDNNEVEDVAEVAAEAVEAAEVAMIADPLVVVVVAVAEEAAPEAAAGNEVEDVAEDVAEVVLDVLPLIGQCQRVAVGRLPHPEDEGLAQPLVRIKVEASFVWDNLRGNCR